MTWKTYLIMYFGVKMVSPSKVATRLEKMGFETTFGSVDFVYEWKDKRPSKEEVLALGDKVAKVLRGSGAVFNLDTHD